ncbi:MAG: diacylglycerol kinase family lipid kinase [Tyzzerella sp.]|nr:diacylglycerol kinase family lipid kinase [Tyzzerella sp.]
MYNFIVNPNARSGLGQSVWNDLEAILQKENIEYQVYYTKYQKHATAIVRDITSNGEENIIVALGGDGTVNEVVNGIVDFSKTILGYIPIGSSNDFARGLELPTNPVDALNTILTCPHLHPMNVGEMRYKNKLRRFAVSAGVGFDADICHEVVVSHVKKFLNKLGLGKLTYVCVALHRLIVTSPCKFEITIDEKKTITYEKAYFAAIMNNRFEGGGAKFAPNAKNDDDKLDVCVVANIGKLKALMLFPMAFLGIHTKFKGVHMHRATNFHIQTSRPLPLHTDGEPIFIQKDISFCCAPEKLRVITTKP